MTYRNYPKKHLNNPKPLETFLYEQILLLPSPSPFLLARPSTPPLSPYPPPTFIFSLSPLLVYPLSCSTPLLPPLSALISPQPLLPFPAPQYHLSSPLTFLPSSAPHTPRPLSPRPCSETQSKAML